MRISGLTAEDVKTVRGWPPYPSEFSGLDYALREHGWLDQFPDRPSNHRYGARIDGALIGFSILSQTAEREAEFYIALRPDKVGQGFGKTLTQLVLTKGFKELCLQRIHLRVRTWHTRAIRLYEGAGFRKMNETESEIDGRKVRVLVMEIRTRELPSGRDSGGVRRGLGSAHAG